MSSSSSLKIRSSPSGATVFGVPIYTLGGDKLQIHDRDYQLFPEIYKALSYTGYTGETMKNEKDISMMNNFSNDLVDTGIEDRPSNREIFLTTKLLSLVEDIQGQTFDEIKDSSDNDLKGDGVKSIIPSNIIDVYTRL